MGAPYVRVFVGVRTNLGAWLRPPTRVAFPRLPLLGQAHVSKIQWTPLRPSGDPPGASVSILLRRGMDRATIERNLAQVERDSRAASEDIAHQQETLSNLVQHGENTTEALRSIGIL